MTNKKIEQAHDVLVEADLTNKASMKTAIQFAISLLADGLSEMESKDEAYNDTVRYDDENPNYIKGTEDGI